MQWVFDIVFTRNGMILYTFESDSLETAEKRQEEMARALKYANVDCVEVSEVYESSGAAVV